MGVARWPRAPRVLAPACSSSAAAPATSPAAGVMTIYSERFLSCEGNGVSAIAWVPAGQRWVLRDFLLSRVGEVGGGNLGVAGVWNLVFNFPADDYALALDIRVVAYAGESVEIVTYGSATWATLSGYAFADPENRSGPPVEQVNGSRPIADVLPGPR